ncbi:ankyrin repeat domain-containing protein [Brachyspira alvinipulli]|uniref:ankyrin repeat domain-containing protein n=1 Tax=Brachyspira alvinipulli TaxID=84379 RepID=UPI00300777BE
MKKKKSNTIKKVSTKEKNANNLFILVFAIFIVLIVILHIVYDKKYNEQLKFTNDINKVDDAGLTVIMKSLLNEERKLSNNDIKRLIRDNRNNIDYKIRDNDSKTLLMYAVFNGDKEIIKEIASHSDNIDDIDNNGRTALHWAVYYNKYDAVAALIELGAKTNIKDDYSLTPLDIAQYEGYKDIYEYLSNL